MILIIGTYFAYAIFFHLAGPCIKTSALTSFNTLSCIFLHVSTHQGDYSRVLLGSNSKNQKWSILRFRWIRMLWKVLCIMSIFPPPNSWYSLPNSSLKMLFPIQIANFNLSNVQPKNEHFLFLLLLPGTLAWPSENNQSERINKRIMFNNQDRLTKINKWNSYLNNRIHVLRRE